MEITSFVQLAEELEKMRTEIMQNEVSNKATELMQENIDTEVYAKYTPMSYLRSGELRKGVETKMQTDDTLVVENIRNDHGYDGSQRNVAEIIETGKGYYSDTLDDIIGVRPFTEVTRQELRDGEFRKSLAEGFKKRGIEVD